MMTIMVTMMMIMPIMTNLFFIFCYRWDHDDHDNDDYDDDLHDDDDALMMMMTKLFFIFCYRWGSEE